MGQDAEVAIVGAGPAGAWAAWRLATGGVRVVIFDPSHPREKPCGGGVTGRALSIVAPALAGAALPAVAIRAARFQDGRADRSATVPLSTGGPDLVVCSRRLFDGALFEAAVRAGARPVAERVSDVEPTAGGFVIRTAAHSVVKIRTVIGADGANSLVRRRLGRRFTRAQLSAATGFFAHGATSDVVVVQFVDDPPGYIWSFPRPDHLAIGICAQADAGMTPEVLRRLLARWLARTGIASAAVTLEPYSWPIPSLGAGDLRSLEIGGPHWMLIGDAAGLVDPITREGIFFALQSADDAATAILSAAGDPAPRYVADVRRDILPELAHAARLKAGFFRPQFTRLLVRALETSPAVARIMAGLVAGSQSYAGLKWQLLSTFEWRLAWRLLRLEGTPHDPAAATSPDNPHAPAR